MHNYLEIVTNLVSVLTAIGAVIIFIWRSSLIKLENWQDLVVQDFIKISIELKEISALDVVMGNPGPGQINVNEMLSRVWHVKQMYRGVHYRALAFSARPVFLAALENTARRMDEAYKLMAARDATGFNQIKFLSEKAQLDLLAGLNGGAKQRNAFARNTWIARHRESKIATKVTSKHKGFATCRRNCFDQDADLRLSHSEWIDRNRLLLSAELTGRAAAGGAPAGVTSAH